MRKIDAKYQTSGDITKFDGTPIPDDEPLFLFRGRDNQLVPLLEHYKQLCQEAGSPPLHLESLQQYIDVIKSWQADNDNRVQTPGSKA